MDEFFTLAEASDYLGVSKATLRRYVKSKRLRIHRRVGLYPIFLREDLDRVVKPRRGRPKQKPLPEAPKFNLPPASRAGGA